MRMIVVDDEPLALMDLMETLRKVEPDADVEGFGDAEAALESAARQRVDVAFLDIEMSEMNGLELAKRLKDIRGETNIIFATGFSEYAVDAFGMFASGYLLKPVAAEAIIKAMKNLRSPTPRCANKQLRVQAFGNFEVFVNGAPLRFSRRKSKELFAYLIHKRGTDCSTREIAAVLYGDTPYTFSLQKQVQTIISAMMHALQDAGKRDCIVRSYNKMAVDAEKIDCDLYRFLNREADAVNEYMGEYMANYSWADFVAGYLDSRMDGRGYEKTPKSEETP